MPKGPFVPAATPPTLTPIRTPTSTPHSAPVWKQVTFGSSSDPRIRPAVPSKVLLSNKLTNGGRRATCCYSSKLAPGETPETPCTSTAVTSVATRWTSNTGGRLLFFIHSPPVLHSSQVQQDQAEAFWRSLKPIGRHRGHMLPAWQIRRIKSTAHPSRATAAGAAAEHSQRWSQSSLKLRARGEAYDVDCAGRRQTHRDRFHAVPPINRTIRGCMLHFGVVKNARARERKKRALERSRRPLDASHPRQIQLLKLWPWGTTFCFLILVQTQTIILACKIYIYMNNWMLPTCVTAVFDCNRRSLHITGRFVCRTCWQASPFINWCDSEAWWGSHLGPVTLSSLGKIAATVCWAISGSSTSEAHARHQLSHIMCSLWKTDLIWLCRNGHFHLAKCNQTQMSITASRSVYRCRRPNGRRYIQASVS